MRETSSSPLRPPVSPSFIAPPVAVRGLLGILLLALLLLGLGTVAPAAAAEASGDAEWGLLERVRDSLVQAGPTEARFVQTYIPAGFSAGEKEAGRVAIALPDCLRWDYSEPYPKVFLLCGDTAHYWNPEDHTGRRFAVDREEEPGLDLVLLGVADLRRRYRIEEVTGEGGEDDGRARLRLIPTGRSEQLSRATLEVDRRNLRLSELSYEDAEGNLTRFEIEGYLALDSRSVFSPPDGIEWREGRDEGR